MKGKFKVNADKGNFRLSTPSEIEANHMAAAADGSNRRYTQG